MRVVVALSGGVDSAAAAILLKKQGYEVVAVYMKNWDSSLHEGRDECSSTQDYQDVSEICKILNIPLHMYNFVPEYWEQVFTPYIDLLEQNLNTNPDINCNARIKFGALLDRVLMDFGQDVKLATGHWAKITEENGRFYLGVCRNLNKDQTYFLSALTEQQLSKVLFPLSDIETKDEVRKIVKEAKLSIWDKRDSVGICFIGKRNYQTFLDNYLERNEGDFVDKDTGEVLGKHQGMHLYVLHQRSGLFLKGYLDKYYVCEKDFAKNIIYLCKEKDLRKYLYKSKSRCINLHWIYFDLKINEGDELFVKVRHSPYFVKIKVLSINKNECWFEHENMYVTSPGQAIVFYSLEKNRCLGMGIYVT